MTLRLFSRRMTRGEIWDDGNGRVSRLLVLLQCYHLGIEVGRYISHKGLMAAMAGLRLWIRTKIRRLFCGGVVEAPNGVIL
jgi:hypothetical protein